MQAIHPLRVQSVRSLFFCVRAENEWRAFIIKEESALLHSAVCNFKRLRAIMHQRSGRIGQETRPLY
jgi:hypothetical protein